MNKAQKKAYFNMIVAFIISIFAVITGFKFPGTMSYMAGIMFGIAIFLLQLRYRGKRLMVHVPETPNNNMHFEGVELVFLHTGSTIDPTQEIRVRVDAEEI